MNHWALMLADAPVRLQLLIARSQRISLPRAADPRTRVQALRQALCRAATVRAVYASLNAPLQAAVQELRQRQRGIALAELELRYGPLRSWRALALDPRPRSISEQLVLLGWLLPRPASHRHPTRWLLPPELRRCLPQALRLESHGAAAVPAALPAALRASHTLILAAAQRPLYVHTRGLRASQHRALSLYLGQLGVDHEALCDFMLPLLCDLGVLLCHQGRAQPGPAAHAFLALPPAEQLERLQKSWLASARPDDTLLERGMRLDGIDWPALRRRLCAWIAALPADQLLETASLYSALSAHFGALANSHTHGFRMVDRLPWQPARAEAVFLRALHGPLHWLGFVAWQHPESEQADQRSVFRPSLPIAPQSQPWHCADHGQLLIPPGQSADLLKLLPYAQREADQDGWICYRITRTSLSHAHSQGLSSQALEQLLTSHAGPLPDDWLPAVYSQKAALRIANGMTVVAEQPALLSRLRQSRSLRRLLPEQIAPGVALLAPEQLPRLERILARHGIVLERPPIATHTLDTAAPIAGLSPGDAATLLLACAYYQYHAANQAPLHLSPSLEATLASTLSPRLREITRQAIARLCPSGRDEPAAILPPGEALPLPAMLRCLRRSIHAQRTIQIAYDRGGLGHWEQRHIRPLSLELRYDTWYLRAFCYTRQAERTFRVDRIAHGEC